MDDRCFGTLPRVLGQLPEWATELEAVAPLPWRPLCGEGCFCCVCDMYLRNARRPTLDNDCNSRLFPAEPSPFTNLSSARGTRFLSLCLLVSYGPLARAASAQARQATSGTAVLFFNLALLDSIFILRSAFQRCAAAGQHCLHRSQCSTSAAGRRRRHDGQEEAPHAARQGQINSKNE